MVYFSNQKLQFGYILDGRGITNVCIFSWPFGIFDSNLEKFSSFDIFFLGKKRSTVLVRCIKKNLATLRETVACKILLDKG
jgi:hypothetical protein